MEQFLGAATTSRAVTVMATAPATTNGGKQGSPASLKTADGLFSVDQDLRITSWNEAAERLFGRGAGEALGKKCYQVLCQSAGPGRGPCSRECQVLVNAKRGRLTRNFDLAYTAGDGTRRWLNVSILFESPFRKDGEIVHLVRDVTEWKAVESAVNGHGAPDHSATGPGAQGGAAPARVTLSRREDQVLRLLAAGKTTGEIAEALHIKPVSARNHITRLMDKLGASTRLQAVAIGSRSGLI